MIGFKLNIKRSSFKNILLKILLVSIFNITMQIFGYNVYLKLFNP